MFMKNVGTDNRVNAVELMYATFPFFLVVNASYGGWLLDPVLEFASSSLWRNPYAPRDIGTTYPNATGDPDEHGQGVEQSANMLIMLLSHARISGDGSYISRYYGLLKTWGDYLVNNTSPLPPDQLPADGPRAESTNLAIKGIIGINAMANISAFTGNPADFQHYFSIAQNYVGVWKSSALQLSHMVSRFGDLASSWTLPYELFAHNMLGMNLIDNETFRQEIPFIDAIVSSYDPAVAPISSEVSPAGNAARTMFAASVMIDDTDVRVRNKMIKQLWECASRNSTFPPINVKNLPGFTNYIIASPELGSFFAPIALTLGVANPSRSTDRPRTKHIPVIGGIVGGVLGLVVLVGLAGLFWWRKHLQRRSAVHNRITMVDTENDSTTVRTLPLPFNYSQEAPPVPAKTQREMALGSARERDRSPNVEPAGDGSESLESRVVTGRNVNDTDDRPVSPELLRLRYDVDSLRRIIVQAFQPNYRTEPPPAYNEEPRP